MIQTARLLMFLSRSSKHRKRLVERSPSSRVMKARRVALCWAIAAGFCGCGHWHESELQGPNLLCEPQQPSDIAVVTFNAHHLNTPGRVASYVQALNRTAAVVSNRGASPDLIAVQEVEAADALAALTSALDETFDPRACQCARGHWVVAAVKRERFEVRDSRCLDLGSMLIDHTRCAVRVRAIDRVNRAPVSFIAVHGAWHWNNSSNGDVILSHLTEAESSRTIVAGDFNAQPGQGMRGPFERAGFVDAGDGDGPTHAIGWRVDAILHAPSWRTVCRTNTRDLFDWVRPLDSDRVFCDHDHCSLSDHLPVAARLRIRTNRPHR